MALRITAQSVNYTGSFDVTVNTPDSLFEGGGFTLTVSNPTGFTGLTTAPAPAPNFQPEYHEIFWVHTLREATLGSSPLPAHSSPVNIPSWFNDPNVKYGMKPGWSNLPAGTYYVDSWAVGPNGEQGVNTSGPIVVATQDETFPTTQTICVSNDPGETWAGEKTGCQRATTWAQVKSMISGSTVPMRILFKRGQTWGKGDLNRLLLSSVGGGYLNCVDAWGSGANPQLSCNTSDNNSIFYFAGAANDIYYFVCRNNDFFGDWDPTVCEGIEGVSPFYFRDHSNSGTWFFISACNFSGLYSAELSTDSLVGNQTVMITDCSATNWMDYAFYCTGEDTTSRIYVEGCSTRQNVLGMNGAEGGKNNLFPRHGCMRFPGYSHISISICDGFNRQGWSLLSGGYPNTVDQTFARLFAAGETPADATCYVDRCVTEAGFQAGLALGGESTSAIEHPGNFIVERNIFIGTAMTGGTTSCFARIDLGGTSVRNNLCIMPNCLSYYSTTGDAFFRSASPNSTTANNNSPVRIYHNTLYSAQNATNFTGSSWAIWGADSAFVNFTEENNLVYAPSIDTPVTPGFSMDVATNFADVTADYLGILRFPDNCWTTATGSGTIANGGTINFTYPTGTNQAYWLTRDAGDVIDALRDGDANGGVNYYASESDFTISFGASNITITNTSGTSWTRTTKQLRLDDSSRHPAIDGSYASPSAIPIVRPAAQQAAASGYPVYGDILSMPTQAANSRSASATVGAVQVT